MPRLNGIPNDQAISMHTVLDLVLEQAARTPEAPGVASWDGTLTYAELVHKGALFAGLLASQGIIAQGRVALWAARACSLPACLLGSMMARSVFAILDPAQPNLRTLAVLRVFAPDVLVRTAAAPPIPGDILRWARAAQVAILDHTDARCSLTDWRGERPGPDDLAYVLFTSGTTGVPKGILTQHAPLAHFIQWQSRRFSFVAGERFSVLSGLAHDPLLRDVFAPLACGGMACIPPQDIVREPRELGLWIKHKSLNVSHLTPALGALLAEGAGLQVESLRALFIGGATLKRTDIERIRLFAPRATLVNVYGTSETPQVMVYHEMPPCAAIDDDVPLGTPISDVELLLLDGTGAQVAQGDSGEIVIRSRFLSQGYLHDDSLTRARFSSPTGDSTRRVFRTGDHGVIGSDGLLRFRGRRDDQVKLNGFRVELGEVEATLATHPGVAQVVVTAPSIDEHRHLCAYVVPHIGTYFSETAVRTWARERLPPHMVPAIWIVLHSLPITPNGKVDRRALPPPLTTVAPAETCSGREQAVRDAWRQVLGRTPAPDDDFFAFGGSSLLALRLLCLIEQSTGVRLPMRVMLDSPTPRTLATLCEGGGTENDVMLVPLKSGGTKLPVFILPGGGGISVLAFRDLARRLDPDRPIYGLEVPAHVTIPHTSVQERARSFVREIRSIQPYGPYHLLGFSLGSWIAFEMASQLEAAGQDIGSLIVFDTQCCPRRLRSLRVSTLILLDRYRHVFRQFARRSLSEQLRYAAGVARTLVAGTSEKLLQRSWELQRSFRKSDSRQSATINDIDKSSRQFLRHYANEFAPIPIRTPINVVLASVTSFAGVNPTRDPRLGWRHFTQGGLRVRSVPGSHLGMLEEPHIMSLAEALQEFLRNASA
jgi:amino acid adenylation domain-containing protein